MARTIGTIAIEMVANTARFVSDVNKGRNAVGRFAKQVKKDMKAARKSLNAIGGAMLKFGAVFVGAAALMVKNSLAMSDTTAKFADKLGDTVTALTELQAAGARADVANTTLNMGLQRMTRRVAEAASGTGEAVKALDELGLSAKDLKKLSPSDQFKEITKAMSKIPDQADKVRLSFKLFDAEGVDLVNLMALGIEGMEKWAEEGRKTGAVLSAIDSARMIEANEAIDRGREAFKGLGNVITSAVSPAIAGVANGLADASVENNGFRREIQSTAVVIIGAVGGMATAFTGFFGAVEIGWSIVVTVGAKALQKILELLSFTVGKMAWVVGLFSDEFKGVMQSAQISISISSRRMETEYRKSLEGIGDSAIDTASDLKKIEDTTADMQYAVTNTSRVMAKSVANAGDDMADSMTGAADTITATNRVAADTTVGYWDNVGGSFSQVTDGMVEETEKTAQQILKEEKELADDINAAFRTIPPVVSDTMGNSLEHVRDFGVEVQKITKTFIVDAVTANLEESERAIKESAEQSTRDIRDSAEKRIADAKEEAARLLANSNLTAEERARIEANLAKDIARINSEATADVVEINKKAASDIEEVNNKVWDDYADKMKSVFLTTISGIITDSVTAWITGEVAKATASEVAAITASAAWTAAIALMTVGLILLVYLIADNLDAIVDGIKAAVKFILDIISGFINAVIALFNGIISVINAVIREINKIPYVHINELGYINEVDLGAGLEGEQTGVTTPPGASQEAAATGDFSTTVAVPTYYAHGAAFTNSVVDQPTAFAHGGGLGVMGEDKPEGVLPLGRTSSGDLGVQTVGGGGGGQTINLTINGNFMGNRSAMKEFVEALRVEFARAERKEFSFG